jgi:hypothetical protein
MATARLDAGLFQEYRVQEGPALSFGVELGTLVGTLQIFGPLQSTSAMLAWKGYGADFKCMLHEGAMVTECALRTLEVDEVTHLLMCNRSAICHSLIDAHRSCEPYLCNVALCASFILWLSLFSPQIDDGTAMFHGAAVAARLTLASEGLREAFAELDWESAYVQLRFAPGGFALSTAGVGASCAVEWPKDSPLLEAYECGATACHTYRLTLLAPCVKALAASAKTQLQMNAEGVLLIQHLVKVQCAMLSAIGVC